MKKMFSEGVLRTMLNDPYLTAGGIFNVQLSDENNNEDLFSQMNKITK